MSDIVLKDKSGVKNTYSDITAINIPDGNGGFVKYSLGGTHLPEYDGTVIIEKANKLLGLRRLKENVDVSFEGETIFYLVFESNGKKFNAIGIENGAIIFIGEISPTSPPEQVIVGMNGSIVATDYMEINIIATSITMEYEGESMTIELSAEGEQWLLANTEGVSV